MARQVILDVDTGSDDAVALMCAVLSEEIDLLAVCSVWGNMPVEGTTANTLRVLDAMGATNVPVYKGCPTAMVKYLAGNRLDAPPAAAVINGKTVRMHPEVLPLPEPVRGMEAENAIAFYVKVLRAAMAEGKKLTVVATGPVTNLGMLFSIAPDVAAGIEEIVIMGGGDKQANVTLCAEANIWHDPEAMQIILNTGVPVVLVPLDATHAACVTAEDCKAMRALGTLAGRFAAEMTENRILIHNHTQPLDIPDAAAVHDALALCYLIDPAVLVDVQPVHVEVGLSDFGEGRTVVDRRVNPEAANCKFAFSGDRQRFAALLLQLFAGGPKDGFS